jgi:phosphatidylinositol-3-phosphatase
MSRYAILIFLAALLLAVHAVPLEATAAGVVRSASPHYAHVVVVIEENKSFSTVIGSRDAPYINRLAGQGVLFTNAHAVTHPSEPNYLALFSGSTQAIIDDSCPHDFAGEELASALQKHKLRFAIYSEDMPSDGFTGCAASDGLYRRKHNPVANWQAHLPADANRPFSAFSSDFTALPTVAFVVPNMMDDMHDGSIAQGDTWLQRHLDNYAQWAKTHDSLLIVTWDESDGASSSNRIPMLMVGAHLKAGSSAQYLTHYNLLRTLTDMYGLKPFGLAKTARSIRGIWLSDASGKP